MDDSPRFRALATEAKYETMKHLSVNLWSKLISYVDGYSKDSQTVLTSFLRFSDQTAEQVLREAAVVGGQATVIEDLIHLLDPHFDYDEVFLLSVNHDQPEVFRLLLPLVSVDMNALMNRALVYNSGRIVSVLVEDSLLAHDQLITLLQRAIADGRHQVVRALIREGGISPSTDQYEAIIEAILRGMRARDYEHLPTLRYSPPTDILNTSNTPNTLNTLNTLNIPIAPNTKSSDYLETIRILLTHPLVDPSIDNNWPLVSAVRVGWKELAMLLLGHPRIKHHIRRDEIIYLARDAGLDQVVEYLCQY